MMHDNPALHLKIRRNYPEIRSPQFCEIFRNHPVEFDLKTLSGQLLVFNHYTTMVILVNVFDFYKSLRHI